LECKIKWGRVDPISHTNQGGKVGKDGEQRDLHWGMGSLLLSFFTRGKDRVLMRILNGERPSGWVNFLVSRKELRRLRGVVGKHVKFVSGGEGILNLLGVERRGEKKETRMKMSSGPNQGGKGQFERKKSTISKKSNRTLETLQIALPKKRKVRHLLKHNEEGGGGGKGWFSFKACREAWEGEFRRMHGGGILLQRGVGKTSAREEA